MGRSVQKLRREVEKAKRALSSTHQARVEIGALRWGGLLGDVDPGAFRGDQQRPLQEHSWTSKAGHGGLGVEEDPDRRDRAGRWIYANPEDPAADQGLLQRQGTEPGHQPR